MEQLFKEIQPFGKLSLKRVPHHRTASGSNCRSVVWNRITEAVYELQCRCKTTRCRKQTYGIFAQSLVFARLHSLLTEKPLSWNILSVEFGLIRKNKIYSTKGLTTIRLWSNLSMISVIANGY